LLQVNVSKQEAETFDFVIDFDLIWFWSFWNTQDVFIFVCYDS
jgi:hypothetical protein